MGDVLALDVGKLTRELEEQTFAIAFEVFLDKMASGTPLDTICREYHLPISPPKFRLWVYRDKKRKAAYLVAKALGAEAVEDELLRISDGIKADGTASLDDVARSTLRIQTRKWLLQVWNRRKYGDVKHIEQTTTTRVDPSMLSTVELQQKIMAALGLEDGAGDVGALSAAFDPIASLDGEDDDGAP